MTPREFVKKYHRFAKNVQLAEGIPAEALLAQSALETGWGNTVVGNMMFGVKDTDGINGNEQLLTTTEYHNTPDKKYPVILKVIQISEKRWKYTVKDYFRKYDSPEESFKDHAVFLKKNKRYAVAMDLKWDAELFLKAIAKAGYATDPNYQKSLIGVLWMIERIIQEERL